MEFIVLREGPTLPVEAVSLAQELELRGCRLSADEDRLMVSGPDGSKPELSPADREAITKFKRHLLALVAYCRDDHSAHLRR